MYLLSVSGLVLFDLVLQLLMRRKRLAAGSGRHEDEE